jgi:2-methylcitrate dehydratase PrpD
MMNVTERFVQSFLDTRFEDFATEELDRAKYRLLDSFGVIAAGRSGAGNDALLGLVTETGGAGQSTIMGFGGKVPAHNAAMMNSMIMRSFDFECIEAQGRNGKSVPAHVSGTTIPTALAVAEWKGSSGRDFLTALLVGDDFACRLACAGDSSPFTNPWDNTGTFNGLGAAAIAGLLSGLTEHQMRNALGIALNMLSGSTGNIFDNTMAFKLPIALAARNAVFAAELASRGFTALGDAVAGKAGYFDSFCDGWDEDELLHELGKRHYADVVIKPYSACRATHPSIDAAVALHGKVAACLSQIAAVEVHVAEFLVNSFVGGEFELGAHPQINGAFSLKFTVANALLNGSVLPEQLTRERMASKAIQSLVSKIELIGDLDPALGYSSADLRIVMLDGKTLMASTRNAARGDICKAPLKNEEIVDKYFNNVSFGGRVGEQAAEEALEYIMDIEHKPGIGQLIELFA